jgi:hypothetical protein
MKIARDVIADTIRLRRDLMKRYPGLITE